MICDDCPWDCEAFTGTCIDNPEGKILVAVDDVTWQCGDCGNRYEYSIEHCPNRRLDEWILEAKNTSWVRRQTSTPWPANKKKRKG